MTVGKVYVYGVKLDNQRDIPVIFIQRKRVGKGLPPGTLWHAEHETDMTQLWMGTASQATTKAKEVLASRSWGGVEPLVPVVPVEDLPIRCYTYGLGPVKGGWYRAFVRREGREPPTGAVCVHEHEGTVEEAWELARGLDGPTRAEALEAKILSSAEALGPMGEPEAEPELGAGVVVMHLDSEGQHMGVLLRKADGGMWSMVFFTSNATWGMRRASQDELALAGYVTTRRTYLSPVVVRSGGGLIATRKSFPAHRVATLLGEC